MSFLQMEEEKQLKWIIANEQSSINILSMEYFVPWSQICLEIEKKSASVWWSK